MPVPNIYVRPCRFSTIHNYKKYKTKKIMKLKTEPEVSLMDMNENIYSHETTSAKNNQFSNFLLKSFQELYNTVNHVFRTVKAESRIVYRIVTITIALGFFSLIGLAIDDRTLMGVNVWIKPIKFTISTAIYILT